MARLGRRSSGAPTWLSPGAASRPVVGPCSSRCGACVKCFGSTPAPPSPLNTYHSEVPAGASCRAGQKRWSSRADFGTGRSHNRTHSCSCVWANKSSLRRSQPCSARSRKVMFSLGGAIRQFHATGPATDGVCWAFPILVISGFSGAQFLRAAFGMRLDEEIEHLPCGAMDHLLSAYGPTVTHPGLDWWSGLIVRRTALSH